MRGERYASGGRRYQRGLVAKCGLARLLSAGATVLAGAHALAQDIRYEKYKLDNGMTVILHEDHSLPVATVNIWYRVGAKDEPPGRSGFAHLFEHLMFMGTERVPGNQFDVIMETGGGANNASTSLDRTNYFSEGPAALVPTLLWLDADRLEDLARTMDQAKLDRQRDVVRNEIRQNVENTPYGRAEEYIYRLMYPQGHPYHNAVYGTHEDLESATVWNVKDFFATYYVPNNASLVVAGDIEPAKLKPLIAQLFGTLPRGAPVEHRSAPPVALKSPVRETMIDQIQLPLLKMSWHSPAYFAAGDAEMDLVGSVLTSGKSSRLYRRLVLGDQTAVEVQAMQESADLGSVFSVLVFARPGVDMAALERAVDEELAALAERGPEARELEERKAEIELGKLSQLQSIRAVADKLNEYEYYFGEPNSFKRDLDRYRSATPEAVQHWAREVLRPEARAVIRVLPEQPERAEGARDQRPADLPPAQFAPQEPRQFRLASGMPVMLWERKGLPLVAVNAVFAPGQPLTEPKRAGLAALTGAMLDEGAGELDAVAFSSALQALGASLGADVGQEAAMVSLLTLKRTAPKSVTLLGDAIRRPHLEEDDWSRVKLLHLESLRQQDEEPTIVAARVGLRALFGPDNPYGWPSEGTPETVEALTLEDIRKEHQALFRPEFATLLIAGDVNEQEARQLLERAFGDWQRPSSGAPEKPRADLSAPADRKGLRVYVVHRPDAVQTVIRFLRPAPTFAAETRVPLRLVNTLLGGGFTSRLNQNLREAHGYTYGAASRVLMGRSAGYFVASSSVRTDVTGESLSEFLKEFQRLEQGDIADEEAAKARETLRTDTIQALQGLGGLLATAGEFVINDVPFATLAEDLARIQGTPAARLNELSKQLVPSESGVLVLVGDRAKITEELKDLGLPEPVEVDARANPIR
jgi:zinc protease